jgi:RNA polymerase sigma factor (sigma-70 family)
MTHLAAIARLVTREERRDGDLLAAFLLRRDEAAFAELIRRHGPMAWGVCRRSLPDLADAEDAFQAAFLVLVRKAHQLTRQATVGPWLYRVAAWTARNLRRKNARRLSRTAPLTDVPNVAPRESDFDLDAALLALPEKYRTPLVLCHLIGLSRREAAVQLGCPEGTLSARLSRALAKLRIKLLGQDPLPMLAATASSIVPASLATATERTAFAFVLSSLIPTSAGPAAMLAEGVLRMFWIKKVAATAVAAMVMVAVAGVMVGVGMQQGGGKAVADEPGKVPEVIQDNKKVIDQTILEEINVMKAYISRLETQKKMLEEIARKGEKELIAIELELGIQNDKLNKLQKVQNRPAHIEIVVGDESELRKLRMQKEAIDDSISNLRKYLEDNKDKANATKGIKNTLTKKEEMRSNIVAAMSIDSSYQILERSLNGSTEFKTQGTGEYFLLIQLKRIRANPVGKLDLVIRAERTAKSDNIQKAMQAASNAGFKGGRVILQQPTNLRLVHSKDPVTSDDRLEYDVPSFDLEKVGEKPTEKPKSK